MSKMCFDKLNGAYNCIKENEEYLLAYKNYLANTLIWLHILAPDVVPEIPWCSVTSIEPHEGEKGANYIGIKYSLLKKDCEPEKNYTSAFGVPCISEPTKEKASTLEIQCLSKSEPLCDEFAGMHLENMSIKIPAKLVEESNIEHMRRRSKETNDSLIAKCYAKKYAVLSTSNLQNEIRTINGILKVNTLTEVSSHCYFHIFTAHLRDGCYHDMEESDTDFTCRGHDFLESIQKYIEFLKGAEPKEREQFADDILSSANSLDAFVDEIAEMYKVSDKHKVFNSILCGYCNVENSWDWDKFGQCSDEPEPCKSYELKWLLDQIRGYAKEIKKFAEKKNLTNISI